MNGLKKTFTEVPLRRFFYWNSIACRPNPVSHTPTMTKLAEKKGVIASMAKRLVSSLILWGIVAAVFFSREPMAVVLLVGILAVLGSYEYLRITRNTPGRQRRIGTFIVSLIYLVWLAVKVSIIDPQNGDSTQATLTSFNPEVVGLLGTIFLAFGMSLRRPIRGLDSLISVGLCLLGFCYVPLLFGGFMFRLTFLPPDPESSGAWLVLFIAVVTKFTDMGAYLSGTLFGKHKMIAHISPGKTWEGAIGAVLLATATAVGLHFAAGETLAWMGPWWSIAILGMIIALAAIVGDLAESVLKRSLEVKDSGQLLPGIGGILDLIDSLCFSAPAAFLYLLYFANFS